MSLRYRLDDLGWFHFERLVQSLLKADIGLAVESWGGRGDYGRDAYSASQLNFPDRSTKESGPFVFQMKFVDGANATGARWRPSLQKAIVAECKRLLERRASPHWVTPKHYILVTNCPLTAEARYAEFCASAEFLEQRDRIEDALFGAAESEVFSGARLSDPESDSSRGQCVEDFAEALSELAAGAGREEIVHRLRGLAEEYKTSARESDPYDDEESYRERSARSAASLPFDVRALFSDL